MSEKRKQSNLTKKIKKRLNLKKIEPKKILAIALVISISLNIITIVGSYMLFNYKIIRVRIVGFEVEGEEEPLNATIDYFQITLKSNRTKEKIVTKNINYDNITGDEIITQFTPKLLTSRHIDEINIKIGLYNKTGEYYEFENKNIEITEISTSIEIESFNLEDMEMTLTKKSIPLWLELLGSLNPNDTPI